MCGIAGIFHYRDRDRPIDRDALVGMTRALSHRGPDAEGFHVDGPVGLGHRRLSIVDLSESGKQPMSTEDGRHTIVYNGEFYDHQRFRDALGVTFRGTSDTETLLHLMRLRGVDALADISAIFGFALWSRDERRLVLARDHLGVKQVYVHDDGNTLSFASEIKALLTLPSVARELDREALNQYLHFHTPLFTRTFFRDVRVLLPGEALIVDSSGARARRFFSVVPGDRGSVTADQAVAELRALLPQVVNDQLLADVPVGAFLSGGIDSTTVATHAVHAGKPPLCFGVHFTDDRVIDERPYQEEAARTLGVHLELTTVEGRTLPDDLPRMMFAQDQPVIGPAMIPMYHVARLASRRVKVCLGGQAADEIFAGYARYALTQPFTVLSSWMQRDATRAAAAPKPRSRRTANLAKQVLDPRNLARLAGVARHGLDWRSRYFDHFAQIPERVLRATFDGELVSRAAARRIFDDTLDASPFRDPADRVMHWDVQTYLPGLFQQDDRMSMAHSLESRVPLADPRLVRFAFSLPFAVKMRGGASKWVLRQAVADTLPTSILSRRKVGFDTPVESWLKGPLSGYLRETLLSSAARGRGIFNAAGLQKLIDSPRHPQWFTLLWKALCLEIWTTAVQERAR
jgi:asparagine synthase (glutamine-hydrolysing)